MKLHISIVSFLVTAACTTTGVQTDPLGHQGSGRSSDAGTATALDANCTAAEGPEHPYTQASELDQLVVGKWIHCSGPTILQNEQVGLEFDADGTYHLLGTDDNGGLVALSGFGNQGTWDASQETATSVQWNIHPDPNSGTGGYPTFEDSPRKFAIDIPYNTDYSIYAIAP